MEQIYDRALKALMEDHAAEMLPELLPRAELVSIENIELNRLNLRADLVYFIKYRGEPRVLNLELQTERDSSMNYRMLQYFVELLGRYKIPIISMVMYPFETNVPEPILQQESGTGTSLLFQHEILRLWLEDAEQCLRRGVVSMYTLLPAMKGVTVAMLLQAVEEMEHLYAPVQLARHLIRFQTLLRRSKTLSEQDKKIVEEKLQPYDSLLDENPEVQRNVANIIVEERQQAVLDVVEARFPGLLGMAQVQVAHLDDRNELRRLAKQIILAPDEQTARWALNTYAA